MGSLLSGLKAEIIVQRLETTAPPFIQPKVWNWYVDDTIIIIIIIKEQLEKTYEINNQQHLQKSKIHKGRRKHHHITLSGYPHQQKK